MPTGTPTPPAVVAQIRQLRDEGLTLTEISRATGVSRNAVRELSNPILPKRVRQSKAPKPPKPPRPPKAPTVQLPDRRRKPRWCDVCKATIYPPCLACQLRKLRDDSA